MGTTQTAVARLERAGSDPRLSTLARGLEAAGERLVLGSTSRPAPELDLDQLRAHLQRSPAERADAHDHAYEQTRAMVLAARDSA